MAKFVKRKKEQPQELKRPWATYYYHGVDDKMQDYVAHGACSRDANGIRATAYKVFADGWGKALIVDRYTETVAYTVKKTNAGISIHYGLHVENPQHMRYPGQSHLRRVA